MDQEELRNLLNEGIQAVNANDRIRARERLLRVLEADDRNEPAWLWLSVALDEPRDQLMALERVLAINPRHPQAQAGVEALRQRLGYSGVAEKHEASQPATGQPAGQPVFDATMILPIADDPAPSGPAPTTVMTSAERAAAGYDMFSFEDDPYQCAYCGRQTHPDDERCSHCGHSLLVPGPWRGGGYLYLALVLTGLQLQSALVQALASYIVTIYPGASRILPLTWLWTSPLLLPATLRGIAWAAVVLLFLGDYEGGYAIAALVAVIDLTWAGVGYWLGYLPEAQAGANAALASIIFLIGLLAVISQAQSRLRLRVVPDRGLVGAQMFHRRAIIYARQGKWALAALHWRRAISHAPSEPLYYKALGRANIRLGRNAQAARVFKSGAEAAPDDREFGRLIEKVRVRARHS